MIERQDDSLVVLQVIPRLKIGGAERAVIDISRALNVAGMHSLVTSQGGELVPDLLHTKAIHVAMPVASKNPLTIALNALRLARMIRTHHVDVIHVRSRAPAWSALVAARRTGTPIVTTFHAPYTINSRAKRLYNSVMARGDRVIAISSYVARHVREEYGVPESRLRRIFRGIDMAQFDPVAVSIDRITTLADYWNLSDGVPVIMFPGRLTRLKGHHVLIDALTQLRRDAMCLMVGVAGARPALRREIENRILAARTRGTGDSHRQLPRHAGSLPSRRRRRAALPRSGGIRARRRRGAGHGCSGRRVRYRRRRRDRPPRRDRMADAPRVTPAPWPGH